MKRVVFLGSEWYTLVVVCSCTSFKRYNPTTFTCQSHPQNSTKLRIVALCATLIMTHDTGATFDIYMQINMSSMREPFRSVWKTGGAVSPRTFICRSFS